MIRTMAYVIFALAGLGILQVGRLAAAQQAARGQVKSGASAKKEKEKEKKEKEKAPAMDLAPARAKPKKSRTRDEEEVASQAPAEEGPGMEEEKGGGADSPGQESLGNSDESPDAQAQDKADADGEESEEEPAELGKLEQRYFEHSLALAKGALTARESLQLHEALLKNPLLTEAQRKRAVKGCEAVREPAAEGLHRSGGSWVSAVEATKRREEADQLVAEAMSALKTGDNEQVLKKLLRASGRDPNAIRADFMLGMLYAPPYVNNPEKAVKHFKQVVARDPSNVPALNNLALCEFREGDLQNAWKHFGKALELQPRAAGVTHNIALAIFVGAQRWVPMEKKEMVRFRSLLARQQAAAGSAVVPQIDPELYRMGWRYLLTSLPRDEEARQVARAAAPLVDFASGTGFVVAPGCILTNRHVVEGGNGFLVEHGDGEPTAKWPAEILAVSPDQDLALLRAADCPLEPVNFSQTPPRRGTDIQILGFPESEILGKQLKSTRGSISSLPTPELNGMLLCDATANPGNSGGPICDARGNVVAVLTAGIQLRQGLAAGIPIREVGTFLTENAITFKPQESEEVLDWPAVDERVSRSTVFLRVQRRVHDFGMEGIEENGKWIRDTKCIVCGGLQALKCTVIGCKGGRIGKKEWVGTGRRDVKGKEIFRNTTVYYDCDRCDKGRIRCPLCRP